MTDFDNTNKGVLFRNERKETEKHPDMTGKVNIAGVEHYLSAWTKVGKSGKFLSLSIGEAVAGAATAKSAAPRKGAFDDIEDDIPF